MLVKRNNNLFDDFFDEMFDSGFFTNNFKNATSQMMRTDIREEEDHFLLDIELPGYEKKDISAELKEGYLTIMASRNEELENKDKRTKYVRKERYSGSVKRTFYVGDEVKENDVEAEFKDGILKVAIKKPQQKAIEDTRKLIPIL